MNDIDIPSASELKHQRWAEAVKDIVSDIKIINMNERCMLKQITLYEGGTYEHVLTDEFIEYIVNLFESKGYSVTIEQVHLYGQGALLSPQNKTTTKHIIISW